MKQHKIYKVLVFGSLLGGSLVSFTSAAHADCPTGFQNNADVNISTGVTVYYCTPLGNQNIAQFDPNLTPNAPVAAVETAPAPVDPAIAIAAEIASTPYVPVLDTDPNDPFPMLQVGDTIPGTFQTGQLVSSCPDGSSVALDYNVARQVMTTYCVKSYVTPLPTDPTTNSTTDFTTATSTPFVNAPIVRVSVVSGTSARGD